MPLGIDRSRFLSDKVRDNEKQMRKKDERIVSLETENAMLYLKLAQLHGTLQKSREDLADAVTKYEAEKTFRSRVFSQASKFKEDIEHLRSDLHQVGTLATTVPQQLDKQLQYANGVLQQHTSMFRDQSTGLKSLQNQILQLQSELNDVTERHSKEKKRRQGLHNMLMELRGNIRVHCRVRPIMEFDCATEDIASLGRPGTKSEVVVHFVDDENVCVKTSKHNKVFEYERVFGPTEIQENVFDEVQPMLTSLLDGYNICIMAYGQTGSGKTHTMLGSHQNDDYNPTQELHPDEGVIPRATRELFRLVSEKPVRSHSLEVSVVEIYNNDIRDLLGKDPSTKHEVVTGSENAVNLPNVTSRPVDSVYDVMCLVQRGLRTRRETATLVHDHSSRSHLVVTLTVVTQAPSFFSAISSSSSTHSLTLEAAQASPRKSRSFSIPQSMNTMTSDLPASANQSPVIKTKLQLVDLAGSECVGMSGVKGIALREASYINKSLSALADVLGALSEQRTHVPYRNSRLTHMLQDSIGGDAKLLVLLCVSPSKRYITESLQCLGFGQRARQVQRGPTKRRLPSSAEKVSYESQFNSSRPKSGSNIPRA